MNCPTDGETLLMSERKGVEIDYCPRRRGGGSIAASSTSCCRSPQRRRRHMGRPGLGLGLGLGQYDTDRDRDRYDSERPYGARRKKKSSFRSKMFGD